MSATFSHPVLARHCYHLPGYPCPRQRHRCLHHRADHCHLLTLTHSLTHAPIHSLTHSTRPPSATPVAGTTTLFRRRGLARMTMEYLKALARQKGYDALAWAVMKDNISALDFYNKLGNFPNYISANELCDESRGWRPDMCARSPPKLILSTPRHPLHSALTPSAGSVLFEPFTDRASTIPRLPKFCIMESQIKNGGLGWYLLEEVGNKVPIWVYDIYCRSDRKFTSTEEYLKVGVCHPRPRHLHRCKPAPRRSVTLPHVFAQALSERLVNKDYIGRRLVTNVVNPYTEWVESTTYGGMMNTGYGKRNNAKFSSRENFIIRTTQAIKCESLAKCNSPATLTAHT